MAQTTNQGPVVKAQPNVYTALLVAGIIVALVAIVFAVSDLTSNYGMSVGQAFVGGGPAPQLTGAGK